MFWRPGALATPLGQPPGGASIAADPLTRELRFLMSFGQGATDLVNGIAPTANVGATRSPGVNGIGQVFNGSSTVVDLGTTLQSRCLHTAESTIMAVIDMPTLGTTTSTIIHFTGPAAARSFSFHANQNTASNLVAGSYNNSATWTGFVTPNNLVAGRRYVLIATANANNTLQVFEVNGVSTSTASITFSIPDAAAAIGARRTAPSTYNSYFAGRIYMAAFWQRQLTAPERRLLAANPWRLLGRPQSLFAPPAAVGATVYRPGSDIIANGWTPSTGSDLFAMLDETTLDRADYITSPNVTDPVTMGWWTALPAGTYDISVDFDRTGATGQLRIVLLDSGGATVGTSSWQAAPASAATTVFNVTTTGTSDRFRIEVQP